MSIQEILNEINDEELITLCQECEIWKQTGIRPDGKFEELYRCVGSICCDKRDLEEYIFQEALKRFGNIVPILLKRYPREFIK